jgi:hypothetical protein
MRTHRSEHVPGELCVQGAHVAVQPSTPLGWRAILRGAMQGLSLPQGRRRHAVGVGASEAGQARAWPAGAGRFMALLLLSALVRTRMQPDNGLGERRTMRQKCVRARIFLRRRRI